MPNPNKGDSIFSRDMEVLALFLLDAFPEECAKGTMKGMSAIAIAHGILEAVFAGRSDLKWEAEKDGKNPDNEGNNNTKENAVREHVCDDQCVGEGSSV